MNEIVAEPHNYMKSIYVGDLHPDVSEELLFEKFSTMGTVLSIRVCRDWITRRSLGYAYVHFLERAEAERALRILNFVYLKGRPIRIMPLNCDPSSRQSEATKVFVKNLHRSIDNKALYDTFAVFGDILSCKVALNTNNRSKGCGFIQFETEESANKSIEKANGMLLNGKKVYLGRLTYRQDREKELEGRNELFTRIFIKNLSKTMSEAELKNIFEKVGRIKSVKIMRYNNSSSRGFGFITFDDADSAKKAIHDFHGKKISEGNPLYVNRAQNRAEQKQLQRKLVMERINRFPGVNVYIGNLDYAINDEFLRKKFSSFGTVTSAKVMFSRGQSRGFGFVSFSSPEEATNAITVMNGSIFGSKVLYVSLARTKENRKADLKSQYLQSHDRMRMQHTMGHYAQPDSAAGGYLPASRRIVYNPLVGRVLNTRYWSTPPLLQAGNSRNPSYHAVRLTYPQVFRPVTTLQRQIAMPVQVVRVQGQKQNVAQMK